MEVGQEWFAVRCVFRNDSSSDWRPPDLEPGQSVYEERVTLWFAASFDDAIAQAEAEAAQYAADVDFTYLGLAQTYRLDDCPAHGAEVFSLMRYSDLMPEEYLDRFFETGTERQQNSK
jgi:hypothetical protein